MSCWKAMMYLDIIKVHCLPSFLPSLHVHDRYRYKVYGTACAIHDRMGTATVSNTFSSHVVTCDNYSMSLSHQSMMQGLVLLPATHERNVLCNSEQSGCKNSLQANQHTINNTLYFYIQAHRLSILLTSCITLTLY
jgi:hypothetical protein